MEKFRNAIAIPRIVSGLGSAVVALEQSLAYRVNWSELSGPEGQTSPGSAPSSRGCPLAISALHTISNGVTIPTISCSCRREPRQESLSTYLAMCQRRRLSNNWSARTCRSPRQSLLHRISYGSMDGYNGVNAFTYHYDEVAGGRLDQRPYPLSSTPWGKWSHTRD